MGYPPLSDERKAVLKRVAKTPGGSWRTIADNYSRETGHAMKKQTAHKLCERYGYPRTPPPKVLRKSPPPVNRGDSVTQDDVVSKNEFTIEETESKVTFLAKGNRFKDFDALLAYGKSLDDRDWGLWKIGQKKMNSWDTTMKLPVEIEGEFHPETGVPLMRLEAKTFTNYQVALSLIPKKMKEMAYEEFVRIMDVTPIGKIAPPKVVRTGRNKILLVVGITDHHFGLYCWAAETGLNYDLSIARMLYVDAFKQLIDTAMMWGDVVEVWFPIGSDLFHINNPDNMTPSHGHVLDVDSRLAKVVGTCKVALTEAIAYAAKKVPLVKGFWVPGNHDPETSFFMSLILEEKFSEVDHVHIDTSPKGRSFTKFGKQALMFTHGDKESPRDYPGVFMAEVPELVGSCKYFEVLTGHKHKEEIRVWTDTSTHGMVVARTLPSLISRDKYHYERGYIGTPRSAMGLVYDAEYGYRGSWPAFADHLIDPKLLTAE